MARGSSLTPTTCSTDGLPGRNNARSARPPSTNPSSEPRDRSLRRPSRFRAGHNRQSAWQHNRVRQTALTALLGERPHGNYDPGVVAMTDDEHLGRGRASRRRPQASVAPARTGDHRGREQAGRDRKAQADTSLPRSTVRMCVRRRAFRDRSKMLSCHAADETGWPQERIGAAAR